MRKSYLDLPVVLRLVIWFTARTACSSLDDTTLEILRQKNTDGGQDERVLWREAQIDVLVVDSGIGGKGAEPAAIATAASTSTILASLPSVITSPSIPTITPPADLRKRQVNVIIGSDPSATISSLSTAVSILSQQSAVLSQSVQVLQQSVQVLQQSVQQISAASVNDVNSAQASAASALTNAQQSAAAALSAAKATDASSASVALASASSSAAAAIASASSSASSSAAAAIASVSSSAADAIASASSSVTMAMAMATAAGQMAQAARTEADNRVQSAQGNTASVTQTLIAVVVAVVGTLVLSALGFFIYLRMKRRKQRRGSTSYTGDNYSPRFWADRKLRPDSPVREIIKSRSPSRESPEPSYAITTSPGRLSDSNYKRKSNWPLSKEPLEPVSQSSTIVQSQKKSTPTLSLFPKIHSQKGSDVSIGAGVGGLNGRPQLMK